MAICGAMMMMLMPTHEREPYPASYNLPLTNYYEPGMEVMNGARRAEIQR